MSNAKTLSSRSALQEETMKKDSTPPSHRRQNDPRLFDRSKVILTLSIVSLVALGGYLYSQQLLNARDSTGSDQEADEDRKSQIMAGGDFYKPLIKFMDAPGIDDPEVLRANQIDLPSNREIIGVEADGKYYALLLEALVDPRQHIVNLSTDQGSVSVTYCDIQDCIRVLESPIDTPVPLRIGGLNEEGELVLLLNGDRYDQTSPNVPLVDVEYTRTTWGAWKSQHPDTLIYVGEILVVRR